MKRVMLVFVWMLMGVLAYSQIIQTTITITGNKARITVKATGGAVSGQVSDMVFSVAIPVANAAATMTVTLLDAARVPPTLAPLASYTDGTYKYFNLSYTGQTAPTSFADNTPYDLIELTFDGSTHAPVTLVTLPDGNPLAPVVPTNWYNYIEVGGIGYSDPPNMFYQSANTLSPQNAATDYSNGISLVTTNVDISLPVNMLTFSGYRNGAKNTLNWTTVTELNNVGFSVERSADGVNYSSIGFVNSLAPGGMSSSNLNYTFDDNNPAGKKQYYRLIQKDIDGHSKQSNVVVITGERATVLGIGGLFPNPTRDQLNVQIDAPQQDRLVIVITDMTGKIAIQQQANVNTGSNTIPVGVSKLASGSYLVKLKCQTSDCESASSKFNKE